MRICPDPLRVVRSIGSDQQWCVKLPASYPTIFPYRPNNIESNGETALYTDASNIYTNSYDCKNIVDLPLCAGSQLIQRLRRKIDLAQMSPSTDIQQSHQSLLHSVKQHPSPSGGRDRVSQESSFSVIVPKSRNLSPSQQRTIGQQYTNERPLSTSSAYRSILSDRSLSSKDSSTYGNQANDHPSQFSLSQSIRSLLTAKRSHPDRGNGKILSSTDQNGPASSMINKPVSFTASTPQLSNQQVADDQLRRSVHDLISSINDSSDHHFNADHISSATDMQISGSPLPSQAQQRVDSLLSSEQSNSFVQSSTGSTSDISEQSLLTPSLTSSYSHGSSSKAIRSTKIGNQSSWFTKLAKKRSNKHLNTTSFHGASPDHISHSHIKNQLNMRDAMATLEFDLTEEACQALINKKKDSHQNRFMRLLTAPSRCCRSCRTQRRIVVAAQRSIDIAIKSYANTGR